MRVFKTIILILIIGLGISSGAAKIMLIPEEMSFFSEVGFNETLLIIFGSIQLVSSIFLIFERLRNLGAIILAITFSVSTVLIFLSGAVSFGFFSVLPILMIGFVLWGKNVPSNREE